MRTVEELFLSRPLRNGRACARLFALLVSSQVVVAGGTVGCSGAPGGAGAPSRADSAGPSDVTPAEGPVPNASGDVSGAPTSTKLVREITPDKVTCPGPDGCPGIVVSVPYPLSWTAPSGNNCSATGSNWDVDSSECNFAETSNGILVAQVSQGAITAGGAAIGFDVTNPAPDGIALVIQPSVMVQYFWVTPNSGQSTSGDIRVYVQDLTTGAVIANVASYVWNVVSSEGGQGGSELDGWVPYAVPAAYVYPVNGGDTVRVWIWAQATTSYVDNDFPPAALEVKLNSVEYWWEPG
jgi:hypothetical protein